MSDDELVARLRKDGYGDPLPAVGQDWQDNSGGWGREGWRSIVRINSVHKLASGWQAGVTRRTVDTEGIPVPDGSGGGVIYLDHLIAGFSLVSPETSSQSPSCGYQTGTVWSGPATCGKPAKFTTSSPSTANGQVCGVHARSVRAAGGQTVALLPTIERGQIWLSNDPREAPGRPIVVLSTDNRYVYARGRSADGTWQGRTTRISRSAFQPGQGAGSYRLAGQALIEELVA